ncbi:MAG: threonine aldolase, partial [Dehalococcoidia bacterium]|nr:threonine aldolase [Dehalococcoidia bacterium]
GMRQAGIIAAAGLVALDTMVDRLAEDHENARVLAGELSNINGLSIEADNIQTNIVIFHIEKLPPQEFLALLAKEGIKVSHYGGDLIRMVTHYGISRSDVLRAVVAVKTVLGQG